MGILARLPPRAFQRDWNKGGSPQTESRGSVPSVHDSSLFAAIFYILLIAYLFIILAFSSDAACPLFSGFPKLRGQFVFLVLCLAGITLSLYGLFCFAFEEYLKSRWYRPKFGGVSLKESYITKEQLKAVLDEQELKIGEILLQSGRITKEQLETALTHQQTGSGRLGEVLKQLEYAEDEDIYWALGRMQRKIGEIMMDKGFLTREDVDWILDQQKTGPPYPLTQESVRPPRQGEPSIRHTDSPLDFVRFYLFSACFPTMKGNFAKNLRPCPSSRARISSHSRIPACQPIATRNFRLCP